MHATEQHQRQASVHLNDEWRNEGHADVDRTGNEALV